MILKKSSRLWHIIGTYQESELTHQYFIHNSYFFFIPI